MTIYPKIQLLITGGTLDKNYAPLTGELVFSQTHLPEILKEANCQLNLVQQVLMLKDSLAMTDADRQQINQACQQTNHTHIVITHGTDTMVKTALTLIKNTDLANKTIVLTGAMRPFKLGSSDALFNLGSALSSVTLIPAGVYIAMNGQVLEASQVVKDTTQGIFVSTKSARS